MANEFKKLQLNLKRLITASFNKAGKSAVSRVTRLVIKDYNIKKKWVDARTKQVKASSSGVKSGQLKYSVIISSSSIPLILFKPIQLGKRKKGQNRRKNRRAGVKVRIKRNKPTFIEGGFIATMRYGEMAFKRETKKPTPVYSLKSGPQISQLFTSNIAIRSLEKEARIRFEEIFRQKIGRYV